MFVDKNFIFRISPVPVGNPPATQPSPEPGKGLVIKQTGITQIKFYTEPLTINGVPIVHKVVDLVGLKNELTILSASLYHTNTGQILEKNTEALNGKIYFKDTNVDALKQALIHIKFNNGFYTQFTMLDNPDWLLEEQDVHILSEEELIVKPTDVSQLDVLEDL